MDIGLRYGCGEQTRKSKAIFASQELARTKKTQCSGIGNMRLDPIIILEKAFHFLDFVC